MELQGRVALVTGAASGVGLATARRLAYEGMDVCVVDIDRDAAWEVANEIDGMAFTCDVADPDRVAEAFAICPSTTDTDMLDRRTRDLVERLGVPVLQPEEVADAVVRAATAPLDTSGSCWVCQPGTPPRAFEFSDFTWTDDLLNVPIPPAHA